MHFLCDAKDLKQPVEGTLKVYGKSLATVLDEVHFIVNLYSFPLSLVPQLNPSFPKVSHLLTPGPPVKPFLPQSKSFAPTPRQYNFRNFPLFFC